MAKTKSSTSLKLSKPAGMSSAEWHDHKVKGLVALVLIILAAFVFFRTDFAKEHLGSSMPKLNPIDVDDTVVPVNPAAKPVSTFRVISPAAGQKLTVNSKVLIKWAGGNGKAATVALEDPSCAGQKTCIDYVITKSGSEATGVNWTVPSSLKANFINKAVNIKISESDGKVARQSVTIASATK